MVKMWTYLIMLVASAAATEKPWHPAVDQELLIQRKNSPADLMTVSSGAAIPYCQSNNTLNTPLLTHTFFMDQMTNQVRERINERTAHTKGTGAFGYFEVTHDITDICKAKLFDKVGKRTPVAVRFSQSTGEKGGNGLHRGLRGFAVKFYTEDGNFDLPCLNVPTFLTKDPFKFTKLTYHVRKDPALYFFNPIRTWELILALPESVNTFLHVFGDRGIPKSYRHMPGFNIHTLQVVNEQGVRSFIRCHFMPTKGVKHMETEEAQQMALTNPSYYVSDLQTAINEGDLPSWTMSIQIVTEDDIQRCGYRLFDPACVLPIKEFPLHPVGKIVLNRNPSNHFAEIELLAMCPSNLVPGIDGGADKLYEARKFAYTDAQMYRLGPNVEQIPVNCPLNIPNDRYVSSDEPVSYKPRQRSGLIKIPYEETYNFDQAAELYENEMTQGERTRLHKNLIAALKPISPEVQQKVIKLFGDIHSGLGNSVARGLYATRSN